MSDEDLLEKQQSQMPSLNEATARWTNGQAAPQGLGMSQEAESPGSLGMAQDTPEPSGFGQDQAGQGNSLLRRIFLGLEAGGAAQQGRMPLYLQEQKMDMERQQMLGQQADRRQMAAEKIQANLEAKRQYNWGIAEKLISTGNMGALEEFAKIFPDVKPIVEGVGKQHLSSLPTLAKGGYVPQDIMDRVMSPKPGDQPVTGPELALHVKLGMENMHSDMKEEAKQGHLVRALDTPVDQRKPHQKLLVEEHQQKLDLQAAQTDLANANATKARADAKNGPEDHSEANRYHESMFNKPWNQGTPDTQSKALAAKSKAYAEGKMVVTGDTPLGQLGKAQEMRDPVTGKAAPGWMPQSQALKMGYVNIEPTQVNTINQLNNVDASMKEILAAGSTLLRRDTGAGLFEIPRGMLQTPLVSLFKKYAGDPDAQVLQSAIKRISPSLSRLGGDVGNIAVAEQQMYADSIFNDADTLESFTKKIQSIMSAQHRARSSMGFVPDEASYVRRLVIQGKSDAEIKATLEERKRTQ